MGKVRLSGFLEGTSVEVFPRVSDGFTRAVGSVGTAKVKGGELSLKGLETNASYWAVGDTEQGERIVAFMAKDPDAPAPSVDEARSAQVRMVASQGGLASAAPGRSVESNVISGARGSGDSKRVKPSERPVPFANQMDVSGVPQRSDTPFGEAHPKDPKEIVPKPSQSDVSDKTPQRSATEFGEATPKDVREEQPALAQEDAPKGLAQASDTELGSVEPVGPDTGTAESAKSKAAGRSAAKPRAKTTPGKKSD